MGNKSAKKSGRKSAHKSDSKATAKAASTAAAHAADKAASAALVAVGDTFSVQPIQVDLMAISTEQAKVGPADKDEAASMMADLGERLASLQERLFAQSTAGDPRAVLLVLQGMDTAGKDGVIKAVGGLLNLGGMRLASFKKPTSEELAHDFLWRIEKALPAAGAIGIFNRSHYEDVLIARVHNLVPEEVWSQRYDTINEFEARLTNLGTTVVKCFLHVSKEVQKERLAARLDDPTKFWKFNPADIDERGYWNDYQQAYAAALTKCSTANAPWHVIPADHKWYRNWAVAAVLTEALEKIDPQYPPADFDVEEQKQRLASEV
ncbi:polyphosphate kinase 2 family protein [Nakamurella antarctica]|uniref:Polyphosphate kinase 2 family protein n=1 Tax=Nakamurella antarctica TaxID=1902245 RepID=A0A3G8ZKJ5_9ACTN|nr:polyphosphate kinase 2 family protein [Nakamurella antarctica]AZI57708.1 polyphosphate kinase 2 family protein [Nakamurella antarctica]